MAFEFQINQDGSFVNELTNPSEFALLSQGKDFPVERFSDTEAQLLADQLNTLVANLDSEMLTQFIVQRQEAIARAAAFSKTQFDEKLFGGINAGDNEIGLSVLRPGHILNNAPAGITDINDWYFDPGATGQVDWIGTNATPATPETDEVILALGFMDQSDMPTEYSAIDVQEFGRNVDMLPIDVDDARLMDNETGQQLVPLPSLIAQENDNMHVLLRQDRDVERQPRMVGFTFGLGSHLNQLQY